MVGGLDTREHGPAAICRRRRARCSRTPRRRSCWAPCATSSPSRSRTAAPAPAAVARGVEEVALALGIEALLDRSTDELSGGELQRVALGAALAGPPAAGAARRADLAARPGRRRRARLAAAPPQRGVGDGGRARRAPPRALPRRTPTASSCSTTARSPATRRRASSSRGRPSTRPRCRRPARGCSPRAGPAPAARGRQGGARDAARARAARRGTGSRAGAARAPRPPRAARAARDAVRRSRAAASGTSCRAGRAILRGVDLAVAPGRARRADGPQRRRQVDAAAPPRRPAAQPTRGRVEAAGRVALLLQNPDDYLLHERVGDEAPAAALARRRPRRARRPPPARPLGRRAPAPRAGDRDRRAASRPPPCCLDEPTRGMDRAAKGELADRLRALANAGVAVLVATHDAEFAAAFADARRPARRRPRRSPTAPTARGARPAAGTSPPRPRAIARRALTARGGRRADPTPPDHGGRAVSWQLASFAVLGLRPRRRLRLVRARRTRPRRCSRSSRRSPRWRRSGASRSRRCRTSSRRPTSCCSPASRSAARPGFVVGAVAALASNFFFGQGPWTPWQMGAWGLVGVIGAALGAATGRRLGARAARARLRRWPGLLYGAILDFSTWVTFIGDAHARRSYLAISATSLPFNLAHAVGNVVFCLAFGPALRARAAALPRALRGALASRSPRRRRRGRGARAARRAARARPAPCRDRAAALPAARPEPRRRLRRRAGQRSTPLYTAWAAMGLAAAGPARARRRVGALPRGAPRAAPSRDIGDIERTILALRAAGASPRRARRPRPASPAAARPARRDGSFERPRQPHGVRDPRAARRRRARPPGARRRRACAGSRASRTATAASASRGRGAPSGIDDTARRRPGARRRRPRAARRGAPRASRFLRAPEPRRRLPPAAGGASNAQSTAWAVQALVAAGPRSRPRAPRRLADRRWATCGR